MFDYGNRLREATGKEKYRYDAHGRRVYTLNTNTNAYSVWQYSSAGQLMYSHDARNNRKANYIYLGGSLLAQREILMSGGSTVTIKYQHTDALGTPIATTDSTGTILEKSEYEPYGLQVNVVGPPKDGPGYTGHVQDAATGLTYMQQRYYDPSIGKMLSVDPVAANPKNGAGFNRYAYAANNPYKFTDPDGRCEAPTGTRICQRGLASSVGPIDAGGGSHRPLNYTTKPGVKLGNETYSKVSKTADNFHDKTGKKLVVTDGMRTPEDQAARMNYKIANGAGVREYANRGAANEILDARTNAIANGSDPIAAMAAKIQEQIGNGVYISKHLRDAGADFRDRDLSGNEKSILRTSATDAGAVNVLREGIPPHTHVEY